MPEHQNPYVHLEAEHQQLSISQLIDIDPEWQGCTDCNTMHGCTC